MEINEVSLSGFTDLFGTDKLVDLGKAPVFGMEENNGIDILEDGKKPNEVIPTPPVDIIPNPDEQIDPTTGKPIKEVDILDDGTGTGKAGRPKKNDFSDTRGYFEDRIKSGKFVAIEQVDDKTGAKSLFIPSTPEEFDEVFDIQINQQLEERTKGLESAWYNSKSPAWQAVAKYSELTDNPQELIPFLSGIKTIESVAQLNPDEAASAEQIVRARLLQRGDSEDLVSEQIDILKGADKLISMAQKYKPEILEQEKRNLNGMMAQKQEEEREYQSLIFNIRNNAVQAIETPMFGKVKLKQDEKAAIYDMIAEPSAETKGYGIYTAIDNLFERGEFEKLKEIALLLTKPDQFKNYISTGAADKAAVGLAKRLQVASTGNGGGNDQFTDDTPRTVVQRNQYSAKFGRQ